MIKHTAIVLIIPLFIMFSTVGVQAQEWGEIGAKWVYGYTTLGSAPYLQLEYEKDTTFAGMDCKKVVASRYIFLGANWDVEWTYWRDFYFRESNDSVYWYNNNEFQFIYDLYPEVGDEWTLQENSLYANSCENPLPSTSTVTVDSISTFNVEGENINIAYFSDADQDWTMGFRFRIGLGPTTTPWPIPGYNCGGIDGVDWPSGVMCYDSPSVGLVIGTDENGQTTPLCGDLILSSNRPVFTDDRAVFTDWLHPNPTQDLLYFSSDAPQMEKAVVYDLSGKEMMSFVFPESESPLDVSNLAKGAYFIRLMDEAGHYVTLKFIKS